MFIKLFTTFLRKKSLQSIIKIPIVFNSSFGTAITLCRLVYMFMGEMVKFVIYAGALLAACILSAEESVGDTISAKFGNTVSGAAQANVYFEGNGKSGELLCIGHSQTKHAPAHEPYGRCRGEKRVLVGK